MNKDIRSVLPLEIIKWAVFVVMLLMIILALSKGRPSKAAFEDVKAAVVTASNVPAEKESTGALVKRFYGISPDDYEAYCLYAPVNAMDAEELLLIKLKDSSQEESVVTAMEGRIQKQKDAFDGYGAEQTAMLEKSVVSSKGGYVLLYVGDVPDAVNAAFEKAL